jgi:hypothetical protein
MFASENPFKLDGSHVDLGLAFTLTEDLTPGTANMTGILMQAEVPLVKILYHKSTWPETLEALRDASLDWHR